VIGTTSMTCVMGPVALLPTAGHLVGPVGGPVPGAWIAAVLVALATAVVLLPARRFGALRPSPPAPIGAMGPRAPRGPADPPRRPR